MRIYFVSSYGYRTYEPENDLCYWDSATNEITAVSPVFEYDLGLGSIARADDGKIVVYGMRYYRYEGSMTAYYGDWWDGDAEQVSITEDALLYTLDRDLKNPNVLTRDSNWDGDTGWEPTRLWGTSSFSGDEYTFPEVDKTTGEILLYGVRHRPWVDDNDASEGESIHRYSPDGQLLGAHLPYQGYTQWQGYLPTWHNMGASVQAFAHDHARRVGYVINGNTIVRYNFNTGVYDCCPGVFFVVQTSSGFNNPAYAGDNILIDSGPEAGDYRYGWIGAKSIFRSRDHTQVAVDPTTGYIWAVVGGYMPYGWNKTVNIPPGPDSGGQSAPSMQWQLLCIDPDQLTWRSTYPTAPFSEFPYPDDPPPWWVPMDGPIYTDAIVKTIVLWEGPQRSVNGDLLGNRQQISAFTLDPNGGVGYYTRYVSTDDGTVNTVCKVDLNTGESTELFRDDRGSLYDGRLLRKDIVQIVAGGIDLNITGQIDKTRIRFL